MNNESCKKKKTLPIIKRIGILTVKRKIKGELIKQDKVITHLK